MKIFLIITFKIYHDDFYHVLMLHVLNICLDVSFH